MRGLGLINIRAIYGETAVRPKMKLKLVAHLEKPAKSGVRDSVERLPSSELSEDITWRDRAQVVIPVAAGRNLAVLLEAAARSYILKPRGKASAAESSYARSRPWRTATSVQSVLVSGLWVRGNSIALDVLEDSSTITANQPAGGAAARPSRRSCRQRA